MNRAATWSILALLAGCATPVNVASTHDPSVDFTGLRTYAWLPPAKTGDPRIREDRIAKMVPPAVDARMARKGYRRIGEGEPDFRLRYYVLLRVARSTTTAMRDFGQDTDRIWTPDAAPRVVEYREAYDPYGREYEVGELVIEVYDPDGKQPIWRGFAWTELDPDDSQSKSRSTIERAVAKLLEKFPPG